MPAIDFFALNPGEQVLPHGSFVTPSVKPLCPFQVVCLHAIDVGISCVIVVWDAHACPLARNVDGSDAHEYASCNWRSCLQNPSIANLLPTSNPSWYDMNLLGSMFNSVCAATDSANAITTGSCQLVSWWGLLLALFHKYSMSLMFIC